MIVSHIHPSTPEGMELLSETLVPALQDSSSFPGGRKGGEEEGEGDDDNREEFCWSVDVHCGADDEGEDVDGSGQEESEGGSDASGGGDEGERDGDDSGSAQIGPSAYMARKVGKKSVCAFVFLVICEVCALLYCFWCVWGGGENVYTTAVPRFQLL